MEVEKLLRFYLPDGITEISKDNFIDFYSQLYYWKNSKFVEQRILDILVKGINYIDEKNFIDDIFIIMAWKTGHIKHKKSENKECIEFYSQWNQDNHEMVFHKKNTVNCSEICKLIMDYRKDNKEKNIKEFLSVFKDNKMHIGPVYTLTLWYFITGGAEPIYDKYARYAIWNIMGEDDELPKDPSFENIYKIYSEYSKRIKNVFDIEYKEREKDMITWRKVDQALWAYGHCLFVDRS